jgi:hypothetical protein
MISVNGVPLRLLIFLVLMAVLPLSGQQATSSAGQSADQPAPTQSLAEIAKQAQKNKSAHAKKLITEDELDAMKGPIPRISMEGADNADEIVAAIGAYQAKHTKEETEQVVHDWYDNYDTMLGTAIHDSLESKDRRDSTLFTGFQLCQQSDDYQKCELKRQAEMRGARHDQLVMRDDGMVMGRIQQCFMKIRNGITQYGLAYPWFKVRNGNGNGSF